MNIMEDSRLRELACWEDKVFAERGFSYASPAAWNRLPESIHRTSSQAAFKQQLTAFLFCDAFNIVV